MCSGESIIEAGGRGRSPLTLEELEQAICELAAHLAAATCRWLLLVAEFDQRGGWAEWGVRSCAHWLSWRCSIGLATAYEHLRVARRLTELPLITGAFAAGELSYSKARALTRVAEPATEAALLEIAQHATGAQLDKLVRCYGSALSATTEGARRVYDARELNCSWEDDGMLRISGRLTAEEGALFLRALDSARAGEPELQPEQAADGGGEEVNPAGGRRADALVSVARCALATGMPDRAGGDPCELVVHVDAETLAAEQVGARSELADGPVLAPETVRRLGCDAAVVGIVERDGEALSVGRRRRTIPPAIRRALRARDGGCQFPGCTHTRYLHAHHIRHWAHGGPTSLNNLVQLCSHHHRLVHEGGYGVERASGGGVRFRRPDGRPIAVVGAGPRGSAGTLARDHALRRIAIDGDTCRPRSAGDPLDYDIAVDCLMFRRRRPG